MTVKSNQFNDSKEQCTQEPGMLGPSIKLDVAKQEMARVNTDTLAISELKWTRMGEFDSDDCYIYYCGQKSHRRNGVALIVNKKT